MTEEGLKGLTPRHPRSSVKGENEILIAIVQTAKTAARRGNNCKRLTKEL